MRVQILNGLCDLVAEYPNQRAYLNDMMMYAEIGKDRRKLTMAWVQAAREKCIEMERWQEEVEKDAGSV